MFGSIYLCRNTRKERSHESETVAQVVVMEIMLHHSYSAISEPFPTPFPLFANIVSDYVHSSETPENEKVLHRPSIPTCGRSSTS